MRAWVGLLGTAVVLHAAHTVLGLGPDGALFDAWLFNAIILGAAGTCVARGVLRRAERPAWLAFGVAMVIFSAAEVTYAVLYGAAPDYHPVSDALWLAFYPASYAALMLLVRSRMREFTASLWLDGLIGAFAVGAIAAALVFQPVLASTEGSVAFVATHLAFPLGDLLLIAFVVGVFGLRGWRPGRDWLLIGAGLMVIAVADSIYAYQAAVGSYAEGTWLDTLWPASAVLLASAAWSRPSSALLRLEGWRTLIVPCVFALSALVLQVYMFVAGAGALAVALTSATITTVILRAALAFRENLRMVGRMRVDSLTDQLTGLGNRRLLLFDLAAELSAATDAAPRVLGLFDLDGFKRYNDTYGHPAGDALLARLAERMADAVGEGGRAYRMGGDEFCALIDGDPGGTAPAIARVAAALSDHGDRFAVTSSYGMVVLPKEAKDPSAALRLADRRMYGHKSRRHHS
ncbi:MAG: diguanylate cyclase domain-containing protein, partial [Solirubrobacteraceae bacterium]